jgi:hypothetical protein
MFRACSESLLDWFSTGAGSLLSPSSTSPASSGPLDVAAEGRATVGMHTENTQPWPGMPSERTEMVPPCSFTRAPDTIAAEREALLLLVK